MPAGVPVATFAIGQAGAVNAGAVRRRDPRPRRSGSRRARWPTGGGRRPTAVAERPSRSSGQPLMLPPGAHDRHPGRRPARPDDGAGRRAARLPLPCLRQRARLPGRRRSRPRRRSRRSTTRAALARFAAAVDVVTFEFENVPAAALRRVARQRPVLPRPRDPRDRAGPAAREGLPALDRHRDRRLTARSPTRPRCAAAMRELRPPGGPEDRAPGL